LCTSYITYTFGKSIFFVKLVGFSDENPRQAVYKLHRPLVERENKHLYQLFIKLLVIRLLKSLQNKRL
jgi:hypothetical protein